MSDSVATDKAETETEEKASGAEEKNSHGARDILKDLTKEEPSSVVFSYFGKENYVTDGNLASVAEIAPVPESYPQKEDAERVSDRPASIKKHGFRYGCYLCAKRIFDIVSSLIAIIVLSPLILIALLLKWLEDFHNPVYVSERVGKDGKTFKFYKIRTMCPDADKLKDDLLKKGLNEQDGPAFKIKNDPRITRLGRLYRKTSVDELLQLFNVLNGTMSVVGPRPPLPREVEQYDETQKDRLLVKGGLLCLWQIRKNRNSLSFDEWVELDREYIKKQSVLLDLKIIFKGFFMVIFDRSGE